MLHCGRKSKQYVGKQQDEHGYFAYLGCFLIRKIRAGGHCFRCLFSLYGFQYDILKAI